LAVKPYSVLTADPPWPFDDKLPGPKRGAEKHYGVLSIDDIKRFPLPPLRDDAVLLLWRVASMQQEALDVMKAWGFALKSEIVWIKLTKHGKRHFGMGHYVRAGHEVALIGVRGHPKVTDHSIRSVFEAPMPLDENGRPRHSAKPEEFYDLVEKLHGGPYAELFARRHRPGWACFGNQLPALHTAA
jgi:N6-adenosine-specific RNA methylase IME4